MAILRLRPLNLPRHDLERVGTAEGALQEVVGEELHGDTAMCASFAGRESEALIRERASQGEFSSGMQC